MDEILDYINGYDLTVNHNKKQYEVYRLSHGQKEQLEKILLELNINYKFVHCKEVI